MFKKLNLSIVAVVVVGLAMAGCGSDNPAGPSGAGGVTVQGVLLGESAAFAASSGASSSSGPVTVEVEGTTISVKVSGNGTFELEDVEAGTFTLIFYQNDTELGRVTVTAGDGATVKIVVQKKGKVIVVVELEVDDDDGDDGESTSCLNGVPPGGNLELEGDVEPGGNPESFELAVSGRASNPVTVMAGGANYVCNGKTGDDGCPPEDLSGAKVHVRGTLAGCDADKATVEASEVKIQKLK
jgi:hypothetical protein